VAAELNGRSVAKEAKSVSDSGYLVWARACG
jgi:hypothetical protein